MKKNGICLLFACFFLLACSNKDDKETKPDELKKKMTESAQAPMTGDKKTLEYDFFTNQGQCHYKVQKHSVVTLTQGQRIEIENELDYQLVNATSSSCRSQYSENRREVVRADDLMNQMLSKIDQLTDPKLFAILIPEARGVRVISVKQANYKKMRVALVEVQYTNATDSRFYRYIGILSMDSLFLGEFEYQIQSISNEPVATQVLKLAKVGSVIQYP